MNLLSKEATISMNQFYPLFNWDRKQVQISGEVGPGFLLVLVWGVYSLKEHWCHTGASAKFDQAAKWPSGHESSGGGGGVRMLTLCTAPALKPSDIFLPVATHGKETVCQIPLKHIIVMVAKLIFKHPFP